MFWKGVFVIFCVTFVPSYATIICHYEDIDDLYTCSMLIFNPGGILDTTILGNHLTNRSNDDVVQVIAGGSSRRIPPIICSTFKSLEKTKFEEIGIAVLDNNPFQNCNNLKMLSLNNNGIPSLQPFLFQNTILEELYLDNNAFNEVTSQLLDGLSFLKKLSLKGNDRTLFDGSAFERLTNLKHLDISNCNLNTLNPDLFANGLDKLEILNLAENPLTNIPANVFNELTGLEVLALDFNKIATLNDESFKLPELKALFLDSNNLVNLPENVFGHLENLEILYLSQNNFSSGLPTNIFKPLTTLTTLGMHGCSLSNVNPEWFQSLPNLSILLLEENEIEEFPDRTFSSSSNLKLLSLVGNKLQLLGSRSFGSMSSLTHLDVRENQITGIEHHLMNQASALKVAMFTGNKCANFSTLDYEAENGMDMLNDCFDEFDRTPFVVETNNLPTFEWFNLRVNKGWKFINFNITASESAHIGLTDSLDRPEPLIEIRLGEENNTELHIKEGDYTTKIPFTDLQNRTDPLPFRIEVGFMLTLFKNNEPNPFFGIFIRNFFNSTSFGLRTQIPPLTNPINATWDVQRAQQ